MEKRVFEKRIWTNENFGEVDLENCFWRRGIGDPFLEKWDTTTQPYSHSYCTQHTALQAKIIGVFLFFYFFIFLFFIFYFLFFIF